MGWPASKTDNPGLLPWAIILLLLFGLAACGGGGGDRASGVTSGPTEPGQPVDPPAPVVPADSVSAADLEADDLVLATLHSISVNSPPVLEFSLTANQVQTVAGLTSAEVRFSLARLASNTGSAVGQQWVSYIERNEDPVCRSAGDVSNSQNQCTTFTAETDPDNILASDLKVSDPLAQGKVALAQATTENNGTLTALAEGVWRYEFSTDIGDPGARSEVHRACIQFSLNAPVDNLCVDFVPALLADSSTAALGSSLSPLFYDTQSARRIATEATCNSCHDQLAIHGGGRTQLDYCVTCHNPGTSDANSGNVLDLATMVHKIHNGRHLPGGAYTIWGYRNSAHDYSGTTYPQSMLNCTRCHAGAEDVAFAEAQGLPTPEAELTADGHSWVSNPTLAVCESCHEGLLAGTKLNGDPIGYNHGSFTQGTNCAGCHAESGDPANPGGLQADQAHRDLLQEAGRSLTLNIENVTQVSAGETPLVDISVRDADGLALDLKDSAVFCDSAVLDVRIPWDGATEFLNENDSAVGASSPRIRQAVAPAALLALGDNVFRIDTATFSNTAVIPTGISSFAVMIDVRYPGADGSGAECAGDTVYLDSVVQFVATAGGAATARRDIVEVARCNQCHGRYISDSHPTRGVNNPLVCTACHNPNRGTTASSHDLSVTVHAVHAGGFRETPFKGTWDSERLQYPGDLSDCERCHTEDSYGLPLPLVRAAVLADNSSGTYTTPVAAVCSSCHDSALARAHMESQGAAQFNVVTRPDMNTNPETCSVCHGAGASADVEAVHSR
ncbi:OmcA/MtrC family decaheme c-type cytochrome [Ketobacter sp.]|uniref:OmcA/MtrC family decaheme c-type cytochrome n=1 Tax=Ketobacter sp. TaxID=2083498 RepID=UPI0025C63EE7|nr:OmcA/MtrC family decaheme c-type cytochrome [Ketobacter sp.]